MPIKKLFAFILKSIFILFLALAIISAVLYGAVKVALTTELGRKFLEKQLNHWIKQKVSADWKVQIGAIESDIWENSKIKNLRFLFQEKPLLNLNEIKLSYQLSEITKKPINFYINSDNFWRGVLRSQGEISLFPKFGYYFFGKADLLDLGNLSKIKQTRQFDIFAFANLYFFIQGENKKMNKVEFEIKSVPPGGTIRAEALGYLIAQIPQKELRQQLETITAGKELFRFTQASFSLKKIDSGKYFIHLLLDGDHYLEFNINIEEALLLQVLKLFFLS
jgi:hypothetical protein